MYIKKIGSTWFLMDQGEFIESFETAAEAYLALFDQTRRWESLYDIEKKGRRSGKSSYAL